MNVTKAAFAAWLITSAAAAQTICAVHGAGDGKTLDTIAIQKAIDDCAGKGTVRLAGSAKFVSGPILLKSHTVLEIAASAMEVDGLPEAAIQSITLKNVTIDADKGATIRQAAVVSQGLVMHAKTGQPITIGPGVTGSIK